MAFFKLLILSMAFLPWGITRGVESESIFRPFREGKSNYVMPSEVLSAKKRLAALESRLIDTVIAEFSLLEDHPNEAHYESFTNAMNEFFLRELGSKFKTASDKRAIYDHSLNLLRSEGIIDDAFHRLELEYLKKRFPTPNEVENKAMARGPGILLKDYLAKKSALIKAYRRNVTTKEDSMTKDSENPFPLKRYKGTANGYSGLTIRERLFYLYSPAQIKELSSIINLSLSVADAKHVYTTIEFRNGEEAMVIEHSPTEQYRLAMRIMRMKKKASENDRTKLGMPVKDLDLIASAFELGVISYDELSLIVHNKDFYIAEKSFGSKALKYMANLGLLALRINPVTAGYVLIPMILYNSYQESIAQAKKVDEDSFFFDLPERAKR